MISAKEARAKTEEKSDQALVLATLTNIEKKILQGAEIGKSAIDWDLGDNHKLGFEVKNRLEDLGYKTELFNSWKSLRISW